MPNTQTNRVSSADALALLSATDNQGRIDERAFEAQRLIFANEKIGGINAKGLVTGMTGSTSYSPNNKDTFIDAITQRLDKNQARHFGDALDAMGLRDNAVEAVARDIRSIVSNSWDTVKKTASQLDDMASDGLAMGFKLADGAANNKDNNAFQRYTATLAREQAEELQGSYGFIKGASSHAVGMIGDTVDLVKMKYRFENDPNYRDVMVGMAMVYAADTAKDPSKPYNDAVGKASQAMEDWEKAYQQAKSQGKGQQYLGEGAGVIGIEILTAIIPETRIPKFAKMLNVIDNITPGNVHVVGEAIGDLTRHLDAPAELLTHRNSAATGQTLAVGKVARHADDLVTGGLDDLAQKVQQGGGNIGAQLGVKGFTRMARHDNVLEDLIVNAKPGAVDAMMRQGSFTPQELGQMLRSEKPALGEQLFENVKFNEALNATTKGVDLAQLSQRHTGDIAEAMMTQKWVKEGYSDIHAIKNNSEHGSDLVGRRPSDKELEFMEVKGSAHGKAKAQTGDPQAKVRGWLNDAITAEKHWDPKNTQLGVKALAGEFRKEIVANGGEINATWAKVNLKRDLNTGELGYDGSVEKWMSPDERKAIKTQSKGGSASKPDGDDLLDHPTPKKTAELSPKDSLGLETMLAAVRKDGRWDEEQSKNIAAAAMLGHVNDPLQKQIDSVRINERGNVFSTYSPHGDKDPHFHSHVNGHEAAQMPSEQSLNQVAQVRQQQQQDAQALTQQQTQDPNTPKGPKLT